MNSLFFRLTHYVCLWTTAVLPHLTSAQIDPFASVLDKKKSDAAAPAPSTATASVDSVEPIIVEDNKTVLVSDPEFEALLRSEIEFKIPIITCSQLYDLQQKKIPSKQLVILDARSAAEFNISHIENAKRVGFEDFSNEYVWSYNRNATIIVYAALGEQSEAIGMKMREMGFKNVYNLYGSILEWVNQGFTIVDADGHKTRQVHVFDKNRAKYLKRGKAVF